MISFTPGVVQCGIRIGLYGDPHEDDIGISDRIIDRLRDASKLSIDVESHRSDPPNRYAHQPYRTQSYTINIPIDHSQDWVAFSSISQILAQMTLDDQRWFFSFRTRGGSVRFCTHNTPDKIRNWSGKSFDSMFKD